MQYDRNFLLQLQFVAGSIEKPAGLPKLPDVILDAVSNAFSTRLNFVKGRHGRLRYMYFLLHSVIDRLAYLLHSRVCCLSYSPQVIILALT